MESQMAALSVDVGAAAESQQRGLFEPAYLRLLRSGELTERARSARRHLENCDLCARYCRVDRRRSMRGAVCRTGERAVVYSAGPHHGEEDCLRCSRGSGTIFFSWCNLRCVYCQNWEIAWQGEGEETSDEQLAETMLRLQALGCHNINLVTPSHVVAQVLAAVDIAAQRGLRLPLVYNTSGYDSPEALALLDGVVDIYMPDMKYGDETLARKYSHVRDYVRVNREAVREMHRQVGDLVIDAEGLAERGLLVRHLALPNGVSRGNSDEVLGRRNLARHVPQSDGTVSPLSSSQRACGAGPQNDSCRIFRGARDRLALWPPSPRWGIVARDLVMTPIADRA
jgi:putative pyruvate formate lyase activating enzyme